MPQDTPENNPQDAAEARNADLQRSGEEPSGQGAPASQGADATEGGVEGAQVDSGNADVDAALARLVELESLAPSDHVRVFEDVHERLKQVLSDLDGS